MRRCRLKEVERAAARGLAALGMGLAAAARVVVVALVVGSPGWGGAVRGSLQSPVGWAAAATERVGPAPGEGLHWAAGSAELPARRLVAARLHLDGVRWVMARGRARGWAGGLGVAGPQAGSLDLESCSQVTGGRGRYAVATMQQGHRQASTAEAARGQDMLSVGGMETSCTAAHVSRQCCRDLTSGMERAG